LISVPNTGIGTEVLILLVAEMLGVAVRVLELPNRSLVSGGKIKFHSNLIISPSFHIQNDPTVDSLCAALRNASAFQPSCGVIYPSTDLSIWQKPYFSLAKRKLLLGNIGRLHIAKAQSLYLYTLHALIHQMKSLGKDVAPCHGITGVVIGMGSLLGSLKNLAYELGIHHCVLFTGSLTGSDLVSHVRKVSIVVHTAVVETFGLTTIEVKFY